MPSTQQYRRRIKSVKSTRQITKAMEMVASVKMQKAVKTIAAGRAYIQSSWNTLNTLAELTNPESHPLLQIRTVKKTLVIVITSDRGMCGSFNSAVLSKASNYLKSIQGDVEIVGVGQRGGASLSKISGKQLLATFTDFGRDIEFEETTPQSKLAIEMYAKGECDRVVMIYSHFVSSLNQAPVVKQILPISREHIDIPELWESVSEEKIEINYKFEPSPDIILENILRQFIRVQIFGALLESNASEHSARMVAMKSATDNAGELIDDLQLTYNSMRQDSITREIAEISAGADALA